MKYAIIGNHNFGKSMLFNALTRYIANSFFLSYQQQKIEIVDLPGVYSLTASNQASIDEKIGNLKTKKTPL